MLERVIQSPPDPLPTAWKRTLANAIATELECGWRPSHATRSLHPTGAPGGNANRPTGGFAPPHPTSDTIWDVLWVAGVTPPVEEVGVPPLAWHLDFEAFIGAFDRPTLVGPMRIRKEGARAGVTRRIFLLKPNRHGYKKYRRNSELVTEEDARIYETAAEAATVWILPPGDEPPGVPAPDVV